MSLCLLCIDQCRRYDRGCDHRSVRRRQGQSELALSPRDSCSSGCPRLCLMPPHEMTRGWTLIAPTCLSLSDASAIFSVPQCDRLGQPQVAPLLVLRRRLLILCNATISSGLVNSPAPDSLGSCRWGGQEGRVSSDGRRGRDKGQADQPAVELCRDWTDAQVRTPDLDRSRRSSSGASVGGTHGDLVKIPDHWRKRDWSSSTRHCADIFRPSSFRHSAIARNEGVPALWKGIGPTLVGVIPARHVFCLLPANTTSSPADKSPFVFFDRPQVNTVLHVRKPEADHR